MESGITNSWIAPYLFMQHQWVRINGAIPNHKITCGLMQGSILGLLIYINNMYNAACKSTLYHLLMIQICYTHVKH